MADRLGFSLYGNLPFLVFLEQELRLSAAIHQGYEATAMLLERAGLHLPFLITFDGP
jgi:hypothetical protein